MKTTYNYINTLKGKTIIKKKYKITLIFPLAFKTTDKSNMVLGSFLLKYGNSFKITFGVQSRLNTFHFTLDNVMRHINWYKYFLRNKLLRKKKGRIASIFFIYGLKLFNNFGKINYNLYYLSPNYNTFMTKYQGIFK